MPPKVLQYRSQPIVIEAVLYDGSNGAEIADFVPADLLTRDPYDKALLIWNTQEKQNIRVPVGHWVIRGTADEFYPCSDEVFKRKYRVAEEPTT